MTHPYVISHTISYQSLRSFFHFTLTRDMLYSYKVWSRLIGSLGHWRNRIFEKSHFRQYTFCSEPFLNWDVWWRNPTWDRTSQTSNFEKKWKNESSKDTTSAGALISLLWRPMAGIFRKRATNYRVFLQKETNKDKASYRSSPPCKTRGLCVNTACHVLISHNCVGCADLWVWSNSTDTCMNTARHTLMRHVTHSYVLRQGAHGLRMRNIWTYEYGTYIWIYEYGTCIHFIYSYIYDKRHMIDVCDTYEYMNMGRVLTSVGSIDIWIWDSHSYVLRQTEHDLRMRYIWIYDHRTIIHFCGTHSYMNMGLAFTSVGHIH